MSAGADTPPTANLGLLTSKGEEKGGRLSEEISSKMWFYYSEGRKKKNSLCFPDSKIKQSLPILKTVLLSLIGYKTQLNILQLAESY